MKKENATPTSRSQILNTIYKTDSMKEIYEQFKISLTTVETQMEKRELLLVEQILFFSYAMTYEISTNTMLDYRSKFINVARALSRTKNTIRLSNDKVDSLFSLLPKPTAFQIEQANPTEATKTTEATETTEAPTLTKEESKVAVVVEVEKLVQMLVSVDDGSRKLPKNQEKDDFKNYIKVAIVSLSTGLKLPQILNESFKLAKDIEVIGIELKEGRKYLNEIRKHIELQSKDRVVRYQTSYSKMLKDGVEDKKKLDRAKGLSELKEEDIDPSRAIKGGIPKLNIENGKDISNLIALYRASIS